MHILFLDDALQKRPAWPGMGTLFSIGGLLVEESKADSLRDILEGLCLRLGFPHGEEFKWSPKPKSWMRSNLVKD
ncbi:MAG: hypothetical protein KGI56_07590, partial [Acidobacteriota bacterium]|nr:hypothetical protein [Acidobacteriota bacterium]